MKANSVLLLCLEIYLILALPAFALIWAALVTAKNGDSKKHDDDLKDNISAEINMLV